MVKVSLINFTKDPVATMCYARRVMHAPVPDSLSIFKKSPEQYLEGKNIKEYTEQVLLKDGMPTFMEYVMLTFKLEDVSRALQQQLTRHRIGFSYSIQSLRCIDLPQFAEKRQYYNPYKIGTTLQREYHEAMLDIQSIYNYLLGKGVSVQDARGVLPMNVYSTITFSCTFRAFKDMINKRLCLKTQDEFRQAANAMLKEIKNIDPLLLKWIGKPCDFGKCMMLGENEEQYSKGLLTGKQNTDHCCPVFVSKFKKVKK